MHQKRLRTTGIVSYTVYATGRKFKHTISETESAVHKATE